MKGGLNKERTFYTQEDYSESISKRSKPNENCYKDEIPLPYFGCHVELDSTRSDKTQEPVLHNPITPTAIPYQPSSSLMGFFEQTDSIQDNSICNCSSESNSPTFKARLQDLTPLICCKLEKDHSLTNTALAESMLNEIYAIKDHNLTMLQSSVRRRLYDCINVLTSIGLINKNGRNLTWAQDGFKIGTPSPGNGLKQLIESTIEGKEMNYREKSERLRDMVHKIVLYKKLASRNRHSIFRAKSILTLPLVLIRISNSNSIECRLSRNHLTAQYTFDGPFTILQDSELLRSLDLSFENVVHSQNVFSGFHYQPDTFHNEPQCVNSLPLIQGIDTHILQTNMKNIP